MSITLGPATETRIQRELTRGIYADADELIVEALNRFARDEDWLLRNHDAINERLDESFAAAERGESYSPEEARTILARSRADRASRAA